MHPSKHFVLPRPPPFSVPVYQATPYTYAGLEFDQLPTIAQHYLTDIAHLPYYPETIPNQRQFLAEALFRALKGIDIALVYRRLEAYHASQEAQQSPSRVDFADAMKQNQLRMFEVLGVLMPERQRILNKFVLMYDALVWLDMEEDENFTQDWQEFRDSLLTQILDETDHALRTLDEHMVEVYMESNKVGEIKGQQRVLCPSDWRARPRHDVVGRRKTL
jgi:hypothetical protein